MGKLQAIQSLLKVIEQAEEPNHDLDKAVLSVLGYTWRGMGYWKGDRDLWSGPTFFTSKIDDALYLVRRDYPGIGIILQSGYRGPYSCCTLRKQDSAAFTTGSMIGQIERPDDEMALAIVGAYLMAKEIEAENSEEEAAA